MLVEITAKDAALVAALETEGLPTVDLEHEPFRYFSMGSDAFGGIGAGRNALLRSIVVAYDKRRCGTGRRLVEELAVIARRDGVQRLWLLTESAAPFFQRCGWRAVRREEAPSEIAQSVQCKSLCPDTATLMVRQL